MVQQHLGDDAGNIVIVRLCSQVLGEGNHVADLRYNADVIQDEQCLLPRLLALQGDAAVVDKEVKIRVVIWLARGVANGAVRGRWKRLQRRADELGRVEKHSRFDLFQFPPLMEKLVDQDDVRLELMYPTQGW